MTRVIHFEIHADDPERAVKFYKKVFRWKIDKWMGPSDYWLVSTGNGRLRGINGAIMCRVKRGSTWNTIDVPSVDRFIKKVVKAGVKSCRRKQRFLEWAIWHTVKIRKETSSVLCKRIQRRSSARSHRGITPFSDYGSPYEDSILTSPVSPLQ